MTMRHNFRFAGTGGQGLITAAIILAEAAIEDNKEAVQSQSYGPEARGGSSKADCIIPTTRSGSTASSAPTCSSP